MVNLIEAGEELQSYIRQAVSNAVTEIQSSRQPYLQPDIIDGRTLCKRLAISEPTLIRWRTKGKIPYMKLGSSLRYDWHKVLAALEAKQKGV